MALDKIQLTWLIYKDHPDAPLLHVLRAALLTYTSLLRSSICGDCCLLCSTLLIAVRPSVFHTRRAVGEVCVCEEWENSSGGTICCTRSTQRVTNHCLSLALHNLTTQCILLWAGQRWRKCSKSQQKLKYSYVKNATTQSEGKKNRSNYIIPSSKTTE